MPKAPAIAHHADGKTQYGKGPNAASEIGRHTGQCEPRHRQSGEQHKGGEQIGQQYRDQTRLSTAASATVAMPV